MMVYIDLLSHKDLQDFTLKKPILKNYIGNPLFICWINTRVYR